jgi:23S rRNA (adenine2030-N6)-methyltransferase
MLSYQHGYHAGGPADVHKHAALCLLMDRLISKEKPFCAMDLFAGEGVYDLGGDKAQKVKEFEKGISRLWPGENCPPALNKYFLIVKALNRRAALKSYPGSPAVLRAFLRDDDRLILNELHPSSFSALKKWAGRDKRIAVHKRDGLEALAGLVPPTIRRGLVLIDPSYEVKSEYTTIPVNLAKAVKKWPQGIFVLWYPILAEGRHKALTDGLLDKVETGIFHSEIELAAKRGRKPAQDAPEAGMLGSGVFVLNPPWQFDAAMADVGAWITKTMTDGAGHHKASWLKRHADKE